MDSVPTYCIVPLCYRRPEFESWVLDLSQSHSISYFASCHYRPFRKKTKTLKTYITNLVCIEECYALIWAMWSVSTWITTEVKPGHIIIAYCSLILLLNYTGGLRAEQKLWNILKGMQIHNVRVLQLVTVCSSVTGCQPRMAAKRRRDNIIDHQLHFNP